jgi:hypothetical protein
MMYKSKSGWQYAVRSELGDYVFIVMRRRPGERWHQAHVLPRFANKQEAEDELAR